MRIWLVFPRAILAAFAGALLLAGATLFLFADLPPVYGPPTAFTVDSTGDASDANPGDGVCATAAAACTLRAAIEEANAYAGHDNIAFGIGTGVQTISPGSELPPVTDSVTIDGTTQPSCADYPCIELDGTGAGNTAYALHISAGNSTVRGLVINRYGVGSFGGGIDLDTNDANLIEDNYIGTDVTGTTGLASTMRGISVLSDGNVIRGNVISGSSERGLLIFSDGNQVVGNRIGTNAAGTAAIPNNEGIEIQNGSGNTIGGTSAADRNIISGNTDSGISISAGATLTAGSNQVLGNYIGLNAAGNAAIPNGTGVLIEDYFNGNATGNTVGASPPGGRNIIAGNTVSGVAITGNGASGNLVQANFIGTNVTGTAAIGNAVGVSIADAPANSIGVAGTGNLISGNTVFGIEIIGAAAAGNLIQGNDIGIASVGLDPLGNAEFGIVAAGSGPNEIGGTAPGYANRIAHNGGPGVAIFALPPVSVSKAILGNSIYSNGGLGIDLEGNGVTPNDPGDGDSGGNKLQNFPVLTNASSDGANTFIESVTLNSAPNTAYRIEFFSNQSCDPSGYGEGEEFIGWTSATTDGAGDAGFNISLGGVVLPGGSFITATATDPDNNTSEFSQCAEVIWTGPTATPTESPTPTPTPTATPTASPTASPTPTPTATPTATPAPELFRGDVDCDDDVDSVDALKVLRHVAGLPVSQHEPCPDIGTDVASKFGDVDCDNDVDAVDALRILRFVASLPNNLPPGCGPIGPGPETFAVNSTTDPGAALCDVSECTLREAINAANAHPGSDTIEFNIPPSDPGCDAGGVCTIVPTGYFPVLSDTTGGTTIDGYTQPGAVPNTAPRGQPLNTVIKIVIDGQNNDSLSGIGINSAGNIIRGLVLSRFKVGDGVQIFGPNAHDNYVEGNFIGTDVTGALNWGNCSFPLSCGGVWIDQGAHDNTIGPDNLIAFNKTQGILVADANSTGNTITRNRIHSNDHDGIRLYLANLELAPPVVTSATAGSVTGTACAACTIEVFSDTEDEGRVYEGAATANGAGNWVLTVSAVGPNVTATATDAAGNTSEFSSSVPVSGGFRATAWIRILF